MKPISNQMKSKGTVGALAVSLSVGIFVMGVSISACSPDKKPAAKGTLGQKAASDPVAPPQEGAKITANAEPSPVASPVSTPLAPVAEGISTELVTLPEPGAYRLNLKINSKAGYRGFYKVSRSTDPEKGFVELVTLNWDQPVFVQSTVVEKERENEAQPYEQVESGKVYYYRVLTLDSTLGTQSLTKEAVTVVVPKDFVFKEGVTSIPDLLKSVQTESNRAELTGFNRVFLMKGARVRVEDQAVSIVTNELVSSEGQIETFLATDHAPQGAAGRDGGLIQIQAKKVTGVLKIAARGEGGGKGTDGVNGHEGNQGSSGKDGKWGQTYGRAGMWVHCSQFPAGYTTGCSRPGDGENGRQGEDGHDGQRGQNGGNSGRVLVKIEDVSNARVTVENLPGLGGEGGAKGIRGAGGKPGSPGEYLPSMKGYDPILAGLCRCDGESEPHWGQPGLEGRDGTAGHPGERGKHIEGCLLLGEKKVGCTGEVTW